MVDDPALLPEAPVLRELRSPEDALITQVEPRAVGHGVIWLGVPLDQAAVHVIINLAPN